jgi:pimeloyl-ACP methyl ester carboxylesterase
MPTSSRAGSARRSDRDDRTRTLRHRARTHTRRAVPRWLPTTTHPAERHHQLHSATFLANDDELAALDPDHYERSASAFPSLLRTVQASQTYEGPESTDPAVMAGITVPVLLLRGQQTRRATFYTDVEAYVAEHVVDPHVHELPEVGHVTPSLAPEPVAEALVSCFGSVEQQA